MSETTPRPPDDEKVLVQLSKTQTPEPLSWIPEALLDLTKFGTALTRIATSAVTHPLEIPDKAVATIGFLAQATLRGSLGSDIAGAISELKAKGDLLDARFSETAQDSMSEILDFINTVEVRDGEKFKAIRHFFRQSIRESVPDAERRLYKEFLKVAKRLEGKDLEALRACYRLRQGRGSSDQVASTVRRGWARDVAAEAGHRISAFILSSEARLVGENLWAPITSPDGSGIEAAEHYRLTDFGIAFCQYWTKSEEELSAESESA